MISLRKPLGSLESPAVSGAGLSPLVDMLAVRVVRDKFYTNSQSPNVSCKLKSGLRHCLRTFELRLQQTFVMVIRKR
jgi:hypothetical protein